MSFIGPFRVASLVPLIGFLAFVQVTLPGTILQLLGCIKLSILDFFITIGEVFEYVWKDYDLLFLTVLFLRYFRLIVNTFAHVFLNEPDQIPEHPTVTSNMAHVIIPSVEPTNADFFRCVVSVLEKRPGWITVVTANQQQTAQAHAVLANLPLQRHTTITVTTGPMANKRHQLAHVLRHLAERRENNKDVLVVFVDDHVWWPSPKFLSAVLAPFENPKVGIVGMHKRPERARGNCFTDSLLNFIACLYLERHNFEICASNAIDGSAFVVSGRTCVIRASIAMEDEFINGFVNERFFFGMFGPLNPDDDNYITRYIVRKGWNIKWQNQPEALMQTSLGTTGGYQKFYAQLQRWARSQWRSNPCSVFTDRSLWRRGYIWGGILQCISFINFALPWDLLIGYLWYRSSYIGFTAYHLLLMLLGSKFVKTAPFFYHNPQDLWLFPFQVLFAYFHSFIKLWALLTFFDHSWGGRNLAAIDAPTDRHARRPSHDRGGGSAGKSNAHTDSGVSDVSITNKAHVQSGHHSDVSEKGTLAFSSMLPSSYRSRSPPSARQSGLLTPWGCVDLTNTHLIPANVRESQYNLRRANVPFTASTAAPVTAEPFESRASSIANISRPGLHIDLDSNAQSAVYGWGSISSWLSRSSSHATTDTLDYLADNELARGLQRSRGDSSTHTLSSPPRTPKAGQPSTEIHTRDPDLDCIHPVHDSARTRTHYYPRVPDAPRKTSIKFKRTSPFSPPDDSKRNDVFQATLESPPKFLYARKFPRGDDCLRTHPDGTFLTIPSGRKGSLGRRRCRSPEPSWHSVVPARPRL